MLTSLATYVVVQKIRSSIKDCPQHCPCQKFNATVIGVLLVFVFLYGVDVACVVRFRSLPKLLGVCIACCSVATPPMSARLLARPIQLFVAFRALYCQSWA